MVTTFKVVMDRTNNPDPENMKLSLRVYRTGRPRKYIRLGLVVSEDAFNKAEGQSPRGEYKKLKAKIAAYEDRAQKVFDSMEYWNYETFKARFLGGDTKQNEIFGRYKAWIEKLDKAGRYRHRDNVTTAMNALKGFSGKKKLYFNDVSEMFLIKFERSFTDNGKSARTAGIYLQTLKTIFKDAIEEKVTEHNPFSRRKYQIPKTSKKSRSLTLDEISRLWSYQTDNFREQEALLYFKLVYLWSGINMKDLLLLKWENKERDSFVFTREKTKRKGAKVVRLSINEEVEELLQEITHTHKPKEFVIPVLNDKMNAEQKEAAIKAKTKLVNKYLKRIGNYLGLPDSLTTYVARHSYATISKRLGIPVSFISDQLGHTDTRTTENYLDQFRNEQAKEFQNKLTQFDTSGGGRVSDG